MLSASLSRGQGDARGLPAPPPGAASPLAPGNDGGGGERRGRWAHPKPKAAPLSLLPTASTRGCPREHPPLSYSSFSAVPPVQPPCSPARTRAQPPPPPVRGRAQRRGRSQAGPARTARVRAPPRGVRPLPADMAARHCPERRLRATVARLRSDTEGFFRNTSLGLRRLAVLREKKGRKIPLYLLDLLDTHTREPFILEWSHPGIHYYHTLTHLHSAAMH